MAEKIEQATAAPGEVRTSPGVSTVIVWDPSARIPSQVNYYVVSDDGDTLVLRRVP